MSTPGTNRHDTELRQLRALLNAWRIAGYPDAYQYVLSAQQMIADEVEWYDRLAPEHVRAAALLSREGTASRQVRSRLSSSDYRTEPLSPELEEIRRRHPLIWRYADWRTRRTMTKWLREIGYLSPDASWPTNQEDGGTQMIRHMQARISSRLGRGTAPTLADRIAPYAPSLKPPLRSRCVVRGPSFSSVAEPGDAIGLPRAVSVALADSRIVPTGCFVWYGYTDLWGEWTWQD